MTPKQVEKIKILDPACGSGSFLIGAYQYLLDWHTKWYNENNPERYATGKKPAVYRSRGGWVLTTTEKKRILLNNIFGVDIDRQAVEVTKLSLLLKVLEGESEETLGKTLALFRERALPDLKDNIKCGNSLIGPDFYGQTELKLEDGEIQRINVFDWNDDEKGFGKIMKEGGFDVVIGNPPYVFTRDKGLTAEEKVYYYSHYNHQSPQLNTFGLFLEKSFKLLSKDGLLGFITPNNWLTIESFSTLRKFFIEQRGGFKVYNNIEKVFKLANVDTAIVIYQKGKKANPIVGELSYGKEIFSKNLDPKNLSKYGYILKIFQLKDAGALTIINKVEKHGRLSQLATVSTGLKAYQTGKGKPKQKDFAKKGRIFHSIKKQDKTYKKYLDGKDVVRYFLGWSGEYLSYGDWLAEPRKSVPFSGARILVRQIPATPPYCVHAVYTEEECLNDINSMVIFNILDNYNYFYLLGILNSRLLSFWFHRSFDKLQRKIFPQFKVNELSTFPIRTIDFKNTKDKEMHDKMVSLVDRMLGLNKKLREVKTPHEKELLERQIKITDNQIDRLVYELYDLTEAEIKVVEGGKLRLPSFP